MNAPSSIPPSLQLVTITIETFLGATYVFPDMSRAEIDRLLKDNIAFHGDLTLSNVGRAVLLLPIRIIKTLSVEGEVKWRGIDNVHELP